MEEAQLGSAPVHQSLRASWESWGRHQELPHGPGPLASGARNRRSRGELCPGAGPEGGALSALGSSARSAPAPGSSRWAEQVVDPRGAEPSRGPKEPHAAGTCRPCHYFSSRVGCANGAQCGFCHFPHATQRRPRPSKATRLHCRRLVERLDGEVGGGQSAARELVDGIECSLRQEYTLAVLRARGWAQAGDPPRRAAP
ncbi:unnamed protein product, partial [Prorocentrum cordatum]